MKAEEEYYPLIRAAAHRIIASGGQCSTALVAKAAGVPITETSPVYRALCSDPELVPDWDTPGMYTVFKRRKA